MVTGGKKRTKSVSKASRAGVLFPVGRIHRLMKKKILQTRLSAAAPVYMAGVLEYLCAEVLELSGNAAKDNIRKRISPRHVLLATHSDEELFKLLQHVTIPAAGVMPHILAPLVAPPRKSSTTCVHKKAAAKTSKKTAKKKSPVVKKTVKKSATKKAGKGKLSPANIGRGKVNAMPVKGKGKAGKAGGSYTILSEKTLINGQKLTVIQGDVVQMKADAIIHPSDSGYGTGGEVGRALRLAGGKQLEAELRKMSAQGSIPTAGASISLAFNIPASHIIHVNSPSWRSTPDCQQQLDSCVQQLLKLAEQQSLASIALPSISSGNAGFPKQTAAQIILASIKKYFAQKGGSSGSLKQIYFVLYDKESINIYTTELGKIDP